MDKHIKFDNRILKKELKKNQNSSKVTGSGEVFMAALKMPLPLNNFIL
jgi:hypothetical protein